MDVFFLWSTKFIMMPPKYFQNLIVVSAGLIQSRPLKDPDQTVDPNALRDAI